MVAIAPGSLAGTSISWIKKTWQRGTTASVPAARLGAKLAHFLPPHRLRQLFAAVMLVVGLKLIL